MKRERQNDPSASLNRRRLLRPALTSGPRAFAASSTAARSDPDAAIPSCDKVDVRRVRGISAVGEGAHLFSFAIDRNGSDRFRGPVPSRGPDALTGANLKDSRRDLQALCTKKVGRMTGTVWMTAYMATTLLLAPPALAGAAGPRVEPGATEPTQENAATSEPAREVVLPAIRYEILASGPPEGSHPTRNSAVKVRYEGRLTDGTVFVRTHDRGDGTEIFRLGGLIPGYVAIVQAMRPGDRWKVFIPVAFAYPSGPPAVAGKDLIFDIELIDFAELPPVSGSPLMSALPKKD